ncbi:MAG: tetratricopeptide repeat protein [Spirochaetaceae bacterium]|jgi:tetratricopeptide (TPR) repeat protein|nr:tetratricopeptide repeat protein [Spirochaetaceae bacterium]
MTRNEKFEEHEKIDFTTRLADFLQHNRKRIAVTGAVIIGVFVIGISGYAIWEKTTSANVKAVEELYDRYFEMGFESSQADGEEADEYIESVREFAGKKSGYAAVRAWTILGRIYQTRKEWSLAEEAWSRAAETRPVSYITPVSLFNAAAAAEEQGNLARAIELLNRISAEYADTFPGIARSSFSLGRLYEKQRDTEAAVSAYRTVAENWPTSSWANLANSRIIALAIAEQK